MPENSEKFSGNTNIYGNILRDIHILKLNILGCDKLAAMGLMMSMDIDFVQRNIRVEDQR